MSFNGTKRTCRPRCATSAFRGKAENICSHRAFPVLTDAVEKVENRTTPKISQMLIFWTTPPLRCSLVSIRRSVVVFLRSDVVPSRRCARNASAALENFVCYPPKDFFDSIGQNRKSSMRAHVFRFAPESGHCATEPACPFRANRATFARLKSKGRC